MTPLHMMRVFHIELIQKFNGDFRGGSQKNKKLNEAVFLPLHPYLYLYLYAFVLHFVWTFPYTTIVIDCRGQFCKCLDI